MAREFAKAFYKSSKWMNCRDNYVAQRIMIDGGLCEECGDVPGEELHHIKPLTVENINDTDISINYDNLKWLCKDCHFKAHKEEIIKKFEMKKHKRITENGNYFENGEYKHRQVYAVWGSPRSGKTTYVEEHKQPGDLVIDVDAIMSALLFTEDRIKSSNLLSLALKVRDFIFDLIEANDDSIDCKAVWIVGGFPTREERAELVEKLNAELIYMDVPYKECIARARQENLYRDKVYSEMVVDDWWRKKQNENA